MSDLLSSLVKSKPADERARGEAIQPRSNDDFFALYPNVYRLMSETTIAGVKRDVSKISIKLCPEGWITTLTEPASGQIMFSQCDTLVKSFEALEERVSGPKPDWRPDKYAKQRKPKK